MLTLRALKATTDGTGLPIERTLLHPRVQHELFTQLGAQTVASRLTPRSSIGAPASYLTWATIMPLSDQSDEDVGLQISVKASDRA